MKSFDGFFYILECALLARFEPGLLSFLKARKTAGLDAIGAELKVNKHLARALCEFEREDGNIIEKRRDLFQYVE